MSRFWIFVAVTASASTGEPWIRITQFEIAKTELAPGEPLKIAVVAESARVKLGSFMLHRFRRWRTPPRSGRRRLVRGRAPLILAS